MIFRYPVNYIAITQQFSKTHFGLDLGWSRYNGGKEQPIYASADGVVYVTHDKDRTGKSWGNYIKIKHDDNTYTLYAHLKEGSLLVRKNAKVKKGQRIATMGNSGLGGKYHLHFEIYIGGANTKYRVDPLPLTYAYPDQVVCDSDKNIVKYYIPTTKPVPRDKIKDQLEVVKNKLRIRTEPSLKADILDFAELGIYNDLETRENDGYVWHKIAEKNWIAEVDGYVELLPKIDFKVGDFVETIEPVYLYQITAIEGEKATLKPISDISNLRKLEK